MKVFADTNVLVAAFATRGLCADVLRTVLAQHELVVSGTVLGELRRALDQKVRIPEPIIRGIIAFLRGSATVVGSARPSPLRVRDPDDQVVLGEALASGAEVLVTGDRDLLDVAPRAGIEILDPRSFWELVKKGAGK